MSDDIPPQMEVLNKVSPILMHFLQFRPELENCRPLEAACHPTKYDAINDGKLLLTVYPRMYCRIFYTIQSDVALQNQMH